MANDINPWMPEPDALFHQAIGKLAEEASETAKIAARCLIQGFTEKHPVTGVQNANALMQEIADLKAVIDWFCDVADLQPDIQRIAQKRHGFQRWEEMIRARSEP